MAKLLRRTGRALGVSVAGIHLLLLVGQSIHIVTAGEGSIFTLEGVVFAVFILLAVAGSVISWWRERIGGILLISSAIISLLRPILYAILAGRDVLVDFSRFLEGSPWWFSTFPFFIAGALLLVSSGIEPAKNTGELATN